MKGIPIQKSHSFKKNKKNTEAQMDNQNNGNNTAVYIQQQQTCNMEMLETALQVSNCLVS